MDILLVEDDKDLAETIKDYLSEYNVDITPSAIEALNKIYEKKYDLIILDVKLKDGDGFSLAKEIRKENSTPIIFLTSLNEEKDVEKGFLSGGDDYIKKPFSLKELKLRIDALLKRVYGNMRIRIGEYEFDLNDLMLYKNENIIHLKPKVAKLLKLLVTNKNRIVNKEEIIDYLYSFDEEPNFASIRTFINNLRKILGKDKIITIKDRGYKFVG